MTRFMRSPATRPARLHRRLRARFRVALTMTVRPFCPMSAPGIEPCRVRSYRKSLLRSLIYRPLISTPFPFLPDGRSLDKRRQVHAKQHVPVTLMGHPRMGNQTIVENQDTSFSPGQYHGVVPERVRDEQLIPERKHGAILKVQSSSTVAPSSKEKPAPQDPIRKLTKMYQVS